MAFADAEKSPSKFRLMRIMSDLNDLKDHVPHDKSPKKSLERLYQRLVLQAGIEAEGYIKAIEDTGIEEIE